MSKEPFPGITGQWWNERFYRKKYPEQPGKQETCWPDGMQELQSHVGYTSMTSSERQFESLYETRNMSIAIHGLQSDTGYHKSKDTLWVGADRESIQEWDYSRAIPLQDKRIRTDGDRVFRREWRKKSYGDLSQTERGCHEVSGRNPMNTSWAPQIQGSWKIGALCGSSDWYRISISTMIRRDPRDTQQNGLRPQTASRDKRQKHAIFRSIHREKIYSTMYRSIVWTWKNGYGDHAGILRWRNTGKLRISRSSKIP